MPTTPTTTTITLPGTFLTYFETSSVGQGQPEDVTGYPNCEDLAEIVWSAPQRRAGKTGTYVKVQVTEDHLTCLYEYGEMMVEAVRWGDPDPVWESAGQRVMDRVETARDALWQAKGSPTVTTPGARYLLTEIDPFAPKGDDGKYPIRTDLVEVVAVDRTHVRLMSPDGSRSKRWTVGRFRTAQQEGSLVPEVS